jgi:multidrug efflux pump subunit AcrA (membrane-fusion protein)
MKKGFFAKKRGKILIAIILLLLAGLIIGGKIAGQKPKEEYSTDIVKKTNLVQTVSEVGVVKADEEVKLSFSFGGKLERKLVKVGDVVKSGDTLAVLDTEALLIQKRQAESSLSSAKASLNKILSGATVSDISVVEAQVREAGKANEAAVASLEKTKKSTNEEIRQAEKNLSDLISSGDDNKTTYEQAVASAQSSLDNAKASYQKVIDNATDNSISNTSAKLVVANVALDNVKTILDDDNLKDFLSAKDKTYLENTKKGYDISKSLFVPANASLSLAVQSKKEADVERAIDDSLIYLNKVSETVKSCYSALENSTISAGSLSAYKTNINSHISLVAAAIAVVQADKQALESAYLSYNANVSAAENALHSSSVALDNAILSASNALANIRLAAEQKITAAENQVKTSAEGLEVAKSQLAKLKTPARSEDVTLANSQVIQAQASLDLIDKQISDSELKSPIDGTIVKDNFERGEQISPNQPVFSVLGKNNFKVEVDISESDIAKIKKGNEAAIAFDAFGDNMKFKAVVDFVEPAETVIQDVVYYKVTLKFTEQGDGSVDVKPGMTANIDITTDKKDGVLVVPERAVVVKSDGQKIIRILRSGQIVESPAEVGLRGDGGMIEVMSGVVEGDQVVVFVKSKK